MGLHFRAVYRTSWVCLLLGFGACESNASKREARAAPAPRAVAASVTNAARDATPGVNVGADAGAQVSLGVNDACTRVAPSPKEPTRSSSSLFALAKRLGAPGGHIEGLPERLSPRECWTGPLATFFNALDALQGSPPQGAPVVVAAFGNSLIASDNITDVVRERLVERFGDGGRGMLLADRIASYGPRRRTGIARAHWSPTHIAELVHHPLPHGLTGVQHRALVSGARTRFVLKGEPRAEVHWLDHAAAAPLEVWLDGARVAELLPERVIMHRRYTMPLPPDAKELKLVARRAGAVVQGVVLEKSAGGIVLDTFGVPSVDATLFLTADERITVAQLASRGPKLVMFLLGGNEVKRLAWRKRTREQIAGDLERLIDRMRRAAPAASCLVVGPLDAVRGGEQMSFAQRPQLPVVIEAFRSVALTKGCAFFDFYAAMGGKGSLNRFYRAGLLHDDLVHPRGKGLDVLGELLARAILEAYDGPPSAPLGALE